MVNYPTLKKGFRRYHLWYKNDDSLTSSEKDELVKYLNKMVKLLRYEDNPVRWEEFGISADLPLRTGPQRDGSKLTGVERLDFMRRWVLDDITWRISTVLRYECPIRIGEALEALECCVDMHQWLNPTQRIDFDPILWIYLCAAREAKGGDVSYDAETTSMLMRGVLTSNKTGPRNFILGCSTLTRLFRRRGRFGEDQAMIHSLAQWMVENKYRLTPYEIRQNMDEETLRQVQARIGTDIFKDITTPASNIGIQQINEYAALMYHTNLKPNMLPGEVLKYYEGPPIPDIPYETDKRSLKQECWVSGCRNQEGLRQCSSCGVSRYCTKEHQREAWPRHKTLCDMYKEQKALYKDLD